MSDEMKIYPGSIVSLDAPKSEIEPQIVGVAVAPKPEIDETTWPEIEEEHAYMKEALGRILEIASGPLDRHDSLKNIAAIVKEALGE